MHLLEKYSLNCGINPKKLSDPFIFTSYYPVPADKYIVFHASSGMQSKNYKYYQEVIDFIYLDFSKLGYKFVQIGGKEDQQLKNCINLNGLTNINQASFIIKNAALLVGNDSFSAHVASAFGIKSVTLYSVSPPSVCGPFWNKQNSICIEAPLKNKKPCYSNVDPIGSINFIKPEQVVASIFKSLNLKAAKLPESIFFGSKYGEINLEFVPNTPSHIEFFENYPLNIRFDYLNSISEENIYYGAISLSKRKSVLHIKNNINLNFIFHNEQTRTNTLGVIFHADKTFFHDIKNNISLITNLKKAGIPLIVNIKSKDFCEKEISDLKFALLDAFPINIEIENNQEKINENVIFSDLTFYKSSRIIFSNEKMFLSKRALDKNIPSDSPVQKIDQIYDSVQEAKDDLAYLYIFNI